MEQRAAAFDNAFPKFVGGRASAKLTQDTSHNDDGEEYQTYSVDVIIPRRCRVAAIFEDVDYAAPSWLNATALLLFVWKLARPG
ncbi:MAG: hypothetical protein HYV94_10310 [Candidatus Rokubacteria bacterium]|nr:hypothetical protein [Candidatus Rokubacteria bacterium]